MVVIDLSLYVKFLVIKNITSVFFAKVDHFVFLCFSGGHSVKTLPKTFSNISVVIPIVIPYYSK